MGGYYIDFGTAARNVPASTRDPGASTMDCRTYCEAFGVTWWPSSGSLIFVDHIAAHAQVDPRTIRNWHQKFPDVVRRVRIDGKTIYAVNHVDELLRLKSAMEARQRENRSADRMKEIATLRRINGSIPPEHED